MPRETFPAGVEIPILEHVADFSNAATVGPDLNANTLATIVDGYVVRQKARIKRIRFHVGPEQFAGGGGTLTFELRKGSAAGTKIASITIPLASALRGAVIEGAVAAADAGASIVKDGDLLYLVRLATGTAFTTGRGRFVVEAWVRPQAVQ